MPRPTIYDYPGIIAASARGEWTCVETVGRRDHAAHNIRLSLRRRGYGCLIKSVSDRAIEVLAQRPGVVAPRGTGVEV